MAFLPHCANKQRQLESGHSLIVANTRKGQRSSKMGIVIIIFCGKISWVIILAFVYTFSTE